MNEKTIMHNEAIALIFLFLIGLLSVINCDNKGSSLNAQSADAQNTDANDATENSTREVNEPR